MATAATLTLFALSAVACSKSASKSEEKNATTGGGRGRVLLHVSIDWEGAYINANALDALGEFRDAHPEIRVTHFVCPAYFARPSVPASAAGEISGAIRNGDGVGLHIHAWHSLARAAGIQPQRGPAYLGGDPITLDDGDTGFADLLSAYGPDEVRALLATSRDLLRRYDFPAPSAFRAGGGGAGLTAPVLEAIRAEGFTVDSSATWSGWLAQDEGPLRNLIHASWPDVTEFQQPFWIDTPAGRLLELPITSGFIDTVGVDQMRSHIHRALDLQRADPDRDIVVGLSIHQEMADEYIDKLAAVLEPYRAQLGQRIEAITIAEIAERVTEP